MGRLFEREAIRALLGGSATCSRRSSSIRDAALLDNQHRWGRIPVRTKPQARPERKSRREIMELHTLGVGGATPDDVTALARIITGWTFAGGKDNSACRSFVSTPMRTSRARSGCSANLPGQRRRAGRSGAGPISPPSSTAKFITAKFPRISWPTIPARWWRGCGRVRKSDATLSLTQRF